jgi:hypothetical protein
MLAIGIAITPLILTAVLMNGWFILAIFITIPLGIALLATVNNTTNWYSVWDFNDLEEAIEEYRHPKLRDQSPGNVEYHTDKMDAKDAQYM